MSVRTAIRALAIASSITMAGLGIPGAIGSVFAEQKDGCTPETCGTKTCTANDGTKYQGGETIVHKNQVTGQTTILMCDGFSGRWKKVGRAVPTESIVPVENLTVLAR